MIFAHPYREAQVTASVYDEFAKERDLLPRWTRTRWLAMEYVAGGLKNGLVTLQQYRLPGGRQVSATCRGIKKIERLMASGKCSFTCHEDAWPK